MAKLKLTKRNVDAAAPRSRDLWVSDAELPGFYLRVSPTGVKTFLVKYRRGTASQSVTIGRHSDALTPDQARDMATQLLAAVKRGEDPARDKRDRRERLTFDQLAALYIGDMRDSLRPSTLAHYEALLRLHAIPVLKNAVAADIDPSRIKALTRKLSDRPATANKLLRVMSALFNWAAKERRIPKGHNPAAASEVDRRKEEGRERFLTGEETARLGAVLAEAETIGLPVESGDDAASRRVIIDGSVTNAIRLLLLTGCRLREILNARWEDIDFENGVLNLPKSKPGKRAVVLSASARQLLAGMDKTTPGPCPRVDLKRPWARVRTTAGLHGVRLHDLRHSFASNVVSGGASLPIVAALLGHASVKTSERYAHLAQSPVRAATDRAGAVIAAKLRAAR